MKDSPMKELLRKKLNEMKDPEQKKALKELVDEFILPMAEYQEERWEDLVNRIEDEVRPLDKQFCDIVTGLCGKDEYDPAHSYLFPILPPEKPNLSGIEASLKDSSDTQEPVALFSVYIDAIWEKAFEVLTSSPVFEVTLRAEGGASVGGTCRLVPDKRYNDVLRDVYLSFVKNRLPWNTVCTAYIDRMASVVLTDWEPFPEDAALTEIDVNFGDFAGMFKTDMIPLWNIARLEMKCNGAIFPLEDNVTFEHYIETEASESEHGYLAAASNKYILSVRREDSTLIITTNDAKAENPDVYKIVRPLESQTDAKTAFPIFTNRRRRLFIDVFMEGARNIFTYAEAMRILSSYDLPVTARDLDVTDGDKCPPYTHGTMNLALDDGFTHINTSKTLCVSFETDGNEKYAQDMIRFLMSEVQTHFPVYRCAGVIK